EAELLRLPAPEHEAPAVLPSGPDGRFLAATHHPSDGRSHRHRLWSLPRGDLLLDVPTDRLGARLAFSPDGRRLAAGRPDHLLSIYDLGTTREVGRLERLPALTRIAFDPGGRLLALSLVVDRVVELRTLDTGAVVARLTHPSRWVHGLAWSGDGATVAAGCYDNQIYLWDAATYQLRAVLKGHS